MRPSLKSSVLALAGVCVILPNLASAEQRPDWIGVEQLSLLTKMGIDPSADVEVKGNYHWEWRARQPLIVGGYTCPAGSAVDISRSITLVVAPEDAACSGRKRSGIRFLKVLPNGSAEPLP